jgi:drug/metabolite transporter (DMT)-like permease
MTAATEAVVGMVFSSIALGPLCALGSSLTWAYGSAIYAQSARVAGPLEVNLTRSLIVLPLFVLMTLVTVGPASVQLLTAPRLGWMVLSTLCSYGVGDVMFYLAAMRLGTPTALAISSAYPVWATLLGVLTLGEKLTAARGVGTLCCIAGVVWLVLLQPQDPAGRKPPDSSPPVAPARHLGQRWLGLVLAVLTSLLWAGNGYSIARGASALPLSLVNAVRYLMAALGLGVVWLWRARKPQSGSGKLLCSKKALRPFLLTAVIEAFFGSSIFVYAMSHGDLSVAAPLSSLAPLFAVPIGLLLRTERINIRRLLAIMLTVAGVILLVA